MALTIDHVPYACSNLEATAAELERLGIAPEYGGVHGNGLTHMSLLGFGDGPCACLFGTDDLAAARDAYPLAEPHSWPDGRVAFFDSEQFGARLGVVERA